MIDIQKHRPKARLDIRVYECKTCDQSIPYHEELTECGKCRGALVETLKFWVSLNYTTSKDLQFACKAVKKKDDVDAMRLAMIKDAVNEYGDNEEASKDVSIFVDKPDIYALLVGLAQSRDSFSLGNLAEFVKNSKGRSNGGTGTKSKNNRQTATVAQ